MAVFKDLEMIEPRARFIGLMSYGKATYDGCKTIFRSLHGEFEDILGLLRGHLLSHDLPFGNSA